VLLLLLACRLTDGMVSKALDPDGDGFGPEEDCAPMDAAVYPGAEERWYDGVDQSCSGNDFDQDGDGFASAIVPNRDGVLGEDCDDLDGAVNPGAGDVWYDGVDQDCDGADDFDQDGDGVPVGEDCDDTNSAVNPEIPEICDTDKIDHDCDGDQNDPNSIGCMIFFTDVDLDGYGAAPSQCLCEAESTFTAANNNDCDDTQYEINPGAAEEVDDGVDSNCDNNERCYADADNDGYRDSASTVITSSDLDCNDSGEATRTDKTGDCDDQNSDINPGATEVCYTGLDEDCSADANDCDLGGDVLTADADYSYTGTASVNFGYELASGDWNDDGFMDLAIGAQNAINTDMKWAGRVYIAYGPLPSTMTFDLEEDAVFEGVNSSDYLGKSITSGGDLDGDGIPDLLMGAYAYNDGGVSDLVGHYLRRLDGRAHLRRSQVGPVWPGRAADRRRRRRRL
jgi:hypothetical protein